MPKPSAKPSDASLPELGVGITYMSALERLFADSPELVDVIEIEPQTLWIENNKSGARHSALDNVFESISAMPFHKIVHSVAMPVGGLAHPDPSSLALLARNIEALRSPWASEHLSFNTTPEFHTGFFLPPRQTSEGVENAVNCIDRIQSACKVPIAVETGVNYLKPRSDEMPDGMFVSTIVERANCGILLDLHNLYCNQINGRQSIETFLQQIPLDRVWEVHLAGGVELDGYWLDAHSGAIPTPLVDICQAILPRLPNLKALIFEIFPSFVAETGIDVIKQQLEVLHGLWQLRGRSNTMVEYRKAVEPVAPSSSVVPIGEWEETLGSLVIGRNPDSALSKELAQDPAVSIIRKLIYEFRGSMIVSVLPSSSRFLMLTLGPDVFTAILSDFWATHAPEQFAATEAKAFADYLLSLDLRIPHFAKVLEYERAAADSLINNEERVVRFDFDPLPLLRALAEGRLPDTPGQPGRFEIVLTSSRQAAATGLGVRQMSNSIV